MGGLAAELLPTEEGDGLRRRLFAGFGGGGTCPEKVEGEPAHTRALPRSETEPKRGAATP